MLCDGLILSDSVHWCVCEIVRLTFFLVLPDILAQTNTTVLVCMILSAH